MVTTGVPASMSRRTWSSCSTATPFLPRGTECREPRIFEFFPFGLGEELDVLGIAARPAAFNVMDPERIELLGDAEFVRNREIDAFALRAVAQGRVIDFDLGFHKWPVEKRRTISLNLAALANPKTGNQQAADNGPGREPIRQIVVRSMPALCSFGIGLRVFMALPGANPFATAL